MHRFSPRFLQRLLDDFNFGRDSSFALSLAGQVPEDELEALEAVEREEEAQAHVLHRRVRNVEQEHIEYKRLQCRQRLQLRKLGSLLALEGHEPACLAGQSKEPSAEREQPRDPVEISNGREPKATCDADSE